MATIPSLFLARNWQYCRSHGQCVHSTPEFCRETNLENAPGSDEQPGTTSNALHVQDGLQVKP